jgi:transposase
VIESVSHGVPAALTELRTLGRILKQRAGDVLAYLERPGTSNAPPKRSTAASNISAAALGFRSLTNYIARPLLETGGFRRRLHRGS